MKTTLHSLLLALAALSLPLSSSAYTIHFNANGGDGVMADQTVLGDTPEVLSDNAFTHTNGFFLGWAMTPDGEATLLDGDSTDDIEVAAGETVTLYAVWHEGSAAIGGECTTGGNANWYVQTSDTHDGIAAARSGAIGHSQSTWLETTVTGAGTISFWWKVSSENVSYDWLAFSIDGSEQRKIGGTGSNWSQVSFNVNEDGEHALRWTYRKDGSASSGSDCGWVGEVTWPNTDKPHKWVVGSDPPQLDGFYSAYAVRFDANGGVGTTPKRVFASGDDAALPAATFTRTGYTFVGWASSTDGPVVYDDGESVEGGFDAANEETITLYARWSEGSYTVHFDANGGTGSMQNQTLWIGIPEALSANAFSCNDLVFSGWATSPDGPVAIEDGASATDLCTVGETVTLYAVWTVAHGLKAQYYDVSSISDSSWYQQVDTYEECVAYHATMAPTIVTNTINLGDALDFGDNNTGTAFFHGKYAQKGTENFVLYLKGVITSSETGTYSFNATHDDGCVVYLDGKSTYSKSAATSGWNAFSADLSAGYHEIVVAMHEGGGGQRLQFQMKRPGETAWSPLPQSVLYATEPCILTFDATGGDSDSTITNIFGTAIASPSDPTRTGYTFAGWNPSVPATMPASNVTCRAQWTSNHYTVHFDVNGGTGEMADLDLSYDESAVLPAVAFSRENQVFTGWATEPDGTVVYADAAAVSNLTATANEVVLLYAVWADSRIVFDANGGEGAMEPFYLFAGTEQMLPESTFAKDGHFLLGWALTPDGEATLFDGDSLDDLGIAQGEKVTLYAVWHEGTGGGNGLSVKYYDISSSGYSTWTQSEAAMTNYFAARTPTMVTNTLEFGSGLATGHTSSSPLNSNDSARIANFGMTALETGSCRFHGQYATEGTEGFAAFLSGYFAIDESGAYSLAAVADDYIVIYIDGTKVANSQWVSIASGSIALDAGMHSISIAYYEIAGGQGLTVQWKKPGDSSYTPIPQSVLSHDSTSGYAVIGTYAVRFDANGGEGTMPKRVYAAGEDMALPSVSYNRDGYTFVGWATSTDGPVVYDDGESVEGGFDAANEETITLYARWSEGSYTVHFDANGGTGSMQNQTLWIGIPEALSANAFSCNDLVFSGWATSPDGPVAIEDGASATDLCTVGETVTLYAVWSAVRGLAIRYYDISSSGYSTWTQSETAMTNYFASRTPTLVTNTLDFGSGLATGSPGSTPDTTVQNRLVNFGMMVLEYGACRLHGNYANESTEHFAALLSGHLVVEEAGTYSLAAMADDYIVIYVDGTKVANSQWGTIASGSIALERGDHSIAIAYYENTGSQGLTIQWKKPGDASYVPIPQNVLSESAPNTIVFDANGGSAGHEITDIFGTAIVPPANPTREGYTFAGWEPTIPATMPASNMVCRAQWTPIRYTIQFDANGGTGEMADQSIAYDTAAALAACTFSQKDHFFAGWATEPDGSVVYTDAVTVSNLSATADSVVPLYAVWADGRVVFDANSGVGSMEPFHLYDGEEQMLPSCAFGSTNGYFLGWALTPDGEATLLDGDTTAEIAVAQGGALTLYAVWEPWQLPLYMVIDLGAGSSAAFYPVTCLDEAPDGGFNAGEYKTTKLALRRIDPAEYLMGGVYKTTLTKPYYIGVFEVTQKQYELVTGSNPSSNYKGDMRPVDSVTWPMFRGDPTVYNWPYTSGVAPDSFVGRLQSRTGWKFDLPTEAQWEYACRAGTTSAYNNGGDTEADLNLVGRYAGNEADGAGGYSVKHTTVGTYLPNAWGLYDMHGNVAEYCIDWYGPLENNSIDPIGVPSDTNKVIRGGSYYNAARYCTSSYRLGKGTNPSGQWINIGYRLALTSFAQPTYAVRFDANCGEGTMPKRVYAAGEDMALPSVSYNRDGYTFVGWATSANGPMIYGDGETVPGGFDVANGETITLFARWSSGTYTVHFDANGGIGAMPDQTLWLDVPQAVATNAFVREGFAFAGWATEPDGQPVCGNGGLFLNGDEANGGVTLYAAWTLSQGLAVRYYDISTSGYSTWMQSEVAMIDYFANQTPTIATNTLAFGDSLDAGFTSSIGSSVLSRWRSAGLTVQLNGCRFHDKYSAEATKGFASFFNGFLQIDQTGFYEFASVADDVVVLYIDGQLILANGETLENVATGGAELSVGLHSIAIAFREQDSSGGQGLSVQWRCSGESTYVPIPQTSLLHAPSVGESVGDIMLWGAVDISSALGSPEPDGRFDAPWGATVELSMPEPLVIDPDDSGVRQACVGWVGTGSVPATGLGTNMSFVLRECSTLTWLWETNSVWVSLAVEGDAEADGETEGWFALGANAVLSFAPTSAVAVVCELSGGAEGVTVDAVARTVTIPADRPRAVTVRVRAMTPADTLETGDAGDWSGVGGGVEAVGGWHLAPDASAADGYSLRSDETAAGETATVELAVPLAGTLTFDWRVLTTARRHYARFYVDGVRQKQITGETDWATETIALGDGAHILRWTYEKSNAGTSGEDAAFLDNVRWTPLTLDVALDATNVVWATEGGADWIPQVSVSSDGASAARSGALVGEETSRLVATVRGEGTFTWSWKAEIEGIAGVDVYLDGEWLEDIWLDSDVVDWEELSLDIVGAGTHEVVFAFWNGGGVDDIGDCAYIDSVSWSGQEERTLLVESEYGTALPAVGSHLLLSGDMVVASVAAPEPANGTRRVCTGWTGTGSVPGTGTETNVTFTIQQDSTLAWNWSTEYWTQIDVTGGTCDFTAQWVVTGSQIEVTISPTSRLYAISLSGDTIGATLDGTTLCFVADRPRTILVSVEDKTPPELIVPDLSGPSGLSFGTDGSGNPTFNVRVSNPVPGVYYTAFVADTLDGPFLADAASRLAEPDAATLLFSFAAGDDRPSRFVRIVASTDPFAAGDPLPEKAGK